MNAMQQDPGVSRWQELQHRPLMSALAIGGFATVCALGLILGLRGLATPTAPDRAKNAVASKEPQAASTSFSSPSGNIHCTISADLARCDINSKSWQPTAKPNSCTQRWGGGLQLTSNSASLVCADKALSGGDPLAYGADVERGSVRCASSTAGIRCTHRDGSGFSLSRSSYQLRP
jgi:hypothetical protein